MSWIVQEQTYQNEKNITYGNKFMIGNGYMGYRGTLEEYSKENLVACNLNGIYDQVADKWREPVNAPNGLYTQFFTENELLSVLEKEPIFHTQRVHLADGRHSRETVFQTKGGNKITIKTERFCSLENKHLLCLKYAWSTEQACTVVIKTGIDAEIWDINGPHLEKYQTYVENQMLIVKAKTQELGLPVIVSECIALESCKTQNIIEANPSIYRELIWECEANKSYNFTKYITVYTGKDKDSHILSEVIKTGFEAQQKGYENLYLEHLQQWERLWRDSDVKIGGDEEAQLALRYSIYQLLIISPTHSDCASIPARGLSGQVYKGAIFWDTEIFMLPFFIYTQPIVARNLINYRIRTLEGARKKAAQYGFRGAFYAWESQDTGEDACTHFNVTDVFTDRPMRTYFRDKQVHISGDIVYAIWQYYTITGDESILIDGAEVILECARFYYSYVVYKPDRDRYEMFDVTGPDEYHERVNNNTFTNRLVQHTFDICLKTIDFLEKMHIRKYAYLIDQLGFASDLKGIKQVREKIYLKQPDSKTKVIEQFDGYYQLEDAKLSEVKSRLLHPKEYWGGGNGIATSTQIIKQADVILMLNLFKDQYTTNVMKANWDFYEPRTEHGSSLSPCVYALIATQVGYRDWAYNYFMKTATIDLTGESKQFAGTIYIGGTHPAANGGAWMVAIFGFAGILFKDSHVVVAPSLPDGWSSLEFNLFVKGLRFTVSITSKHIRIITDENNVEQQYFEIYEEKYLCDAMHPIEINY